jgi:hypothetical protein
MSRRAGGCQGALERGGPFVGPRCFLIIEPVVLDIKAYIISLVFVDFGFAGVVQWNEASARTLQSSGRHNSQQCGQ